MSEETHEECEGETQGTGDEKMGRVRNKMCRVRNKKQQRQEK